MLARLRSWARAIRRDALLLWLTARDPRVPLAAKLLAGAIAAYAFSPLDLIPDAIPLLGLLDEAVLLPLLVLLALRLIPPALREELRARAAEQAERPVSRAGAAVVVALWGAATALGVWWWLSSSAGGG